MTKIIIPYSAQLRFWSYVAKIPTVGGCLIWTGAIDTTDYGVMEVLGKKVLAHRVSVLIAGRKIPEGMQVDHVCRHRRCVNPKHLEVVTPRENLRRSPLTVTTINSKKTHCNHGHPYDKENTHVYVWKYGAKRYCRACNRVKCAKYRKLHG